jgi:hypothetical protein
MVRKLIDFISDQKAPVKSAPRKKQGEQRGPVIEAEYRVLSNKD